MTFIKLQGRAYSTRTVHRIFKVQAHFLTSPFFIVPFLLYAAPIRAYSTIIEALIFVMHTLNMRAALEVMQQKPSGACFCASNGISCVTFALEDICVDVPP